MCLRDSNCNHKLISDVRASRDDEIIFDKPHVNLIQDDENTAEAREKANQNPCYQTLTELGNALAHQMRYHEAIECFERAKEFCNDYAIRRKCAGRYLSVLRLDDAEKEFSWCVENATDTIDPQYMLGCCKYYKGDFEGAKPLFDKCIDLTKDNGDMYVASLYWSVACCVRTSLDTAETMKKFDRQTKIGHHTGYMQTLKLFDGDSFDECDVIPVSDELQKCIFYYGAHLYYLAKDDRAKAKEFLDKTLELDTYFSAFSYLGAYTEYIFSENK